MPLEKQNTGKKRGKNTQRKERRGGREGERNDRLDSERKRGQEMHSSKEEGTCARLLERNRHFKLGLVAAMIYVFAGWTLTYANLSLYR